jgi:glycosyltransferase involved in cell wall biosynthesis
MLILHVITGLDSGGAEGVLFRLCTADTSARHVVISLTCEGHYGPLLRKRQIETHVLGMKRGRPSLSGLVRLARLLLHHQPDVVQTWMYHADLIGGGVARAIGIRNVVWGLRHGTVDSGSLRRMTRFVIKCCALLSRLVPRRIVSCSVVGAAAHAAMGYAQAKLRVVPNGYDVDLFRIDQDARRVFRETERIPAAVPLFGMVARFDPHKDHATLIRALAAIKQQGRDFLCLLVGTGMDETNAQLVELLHRHRVRDRVLLAGRRNDVPAIMNALDVHVLSSRGEAFPNVIAEAMACGTPCVATDVGDARRIMGETGWLVSPGDAQALARGMLSALDGMREAAAWQARRQACRARIVERYSMESMLSGYRLAWGAGA